MAFAPAAAFPLALGSSFFGLDFGAGDEEGLLKMEKVATGLAGAWAGAEASGAADAFRGEALGGAAAASAAGSAAAAAEGSVSMSFAAASSAAAGFLRRLNCGRERCNRNRQASQPTSKEMGHAFERTFFPSAPVAG